MVLMLWFYISGLVILMGAEMNAEIEHASPYGKAHGETVSLRIELAAYFRRPVLDPVVTAADPAKGVSQ